ncbi:MAG: hypothetical protein ACOCP4_01975 [Candidatus Woesearchaeota archaeon]
MITALDVYKCYKFAESIMKNKEFKEPKTIKRLSEKNQKKLEIAAGYFNTIWQNINMQMYMLAGFKLWKNFNVNMMIDKQVIEKYKKLDKKAKKNYNPKREEIVLSINNICFNEPDIYKYCDDGNIIRKPIKDYLKNRIDCVTLCYLIEKKYIKKLNNEERDLLSYFINNYQKIKENMYGNYELLQRNL